jgi:gas vesicle protein
MIAKRVASSAGSVARCARRPVPRSVNARIRTQAQTPRFQSTEAGPSSSGSGGGGSSAAIGGVAGSLATFGIGYIWYRQSGAREIVNATKTTKSYVSSASKKLKDSTPEPNEALDWLRNAAKSYAVFVPGVGGYIDTAFDDLDAIREKHGEEVDDIVKEAYTELQDLARNGELSILTAQKAWSIIVNHLGRIGDLAGDAAQQIMDNHPQLREKVGGNIDKLKEYGQNYGPEAKKEVDRTWDQISDIVKTGMSAENVKKIQNVVQEKVDKLKQLGEEAWKKGMEQAKPYLDKNPEVKKLVEENQDALKSGNVQELYKKIKKAVESGDTGDIEAYVKKAAGKAKETGFGGLDQYLNKIPGGDQIIPKLGQIQEVAQKHGDEAQKIMKDTVSEISEILKKRGSEAEELAKKAKEDSKK